MNSRQRWAVRASAAVLLMAALFWATGVVSSMGAPVVVFAVDVHGLSLASYAGDPVAVAPLSLRIVEDATPPVQPGTRRTGAPRPSSTPRPPAQPTPGASVTPGPTPAPTPTPLPSIVPTPTPVPSSGIAGQVVDSTSKTGIANAVVALSPGGQTAITDSSGAFSFAVSAGTYTLTASAVGYTSASQTVTVKTGKTQTVTIKLNPLTGTGSLKGTVTDAVSGAPIAGAIIVLTPGGLSTATNAGGAFSFPSLPAGDYTMTISATGFTSRSLPVSVMPGQQTTVQVALSPA